MWVKCVCTCAHTHTPLGQNSEYWSWSTANSVLSTTCFPWMPMRIVKEVHATGLAITHGGHSTCVKHEFPRGYNIMSVIVTGVVLWVRAGTLKFWSNCDRERYLPRLSSFVILIQDCISFEDFVLYKSFVRRLSNKKESACQCRRYGRHGFDPWVGKIPWRRKWHPTSGFLPGKSYGQRTLVG